MKKYIISSLALVTLFTSTTIFAYDLEDNYIGGSNPNDVIGARSTFDIKGLDASLLGTTLTVDIYTNFAGKADNGVYPSLTQTEASGWGNGIGYGDLFLADDDVKDGWEYGFSLDNRWSATGGTADLYAVSGSLLANAAPADYLLSDSFISSGTYRNDKEVAVNTNGPYSSATLVSSGSWSVNESTGSLRFSVDLSGTGLPYSRQGIRIGWGETCANDLIQGTVSMDTLTDKATSVPEPAALALVGLGLFGTIINRRRTKPST